MAEAKRQMHYHAVRTSRQRSCILFTKSLLNTQMNTFNFLKATKIIMSFQNCNGTETQANSLSRKIRMKVKLHYFSTPALCRFILFTFFDLFGLCGFEVTARSHTMPLLLLTNFQRLSQRESCTRHQSDRHVAHEKLGHPSSLEILDHPRCLCPAGTPSFRILM